MTDVERARFDNAVRMCEQHANRIRSAMRALEGTMPVTTATLSQLGDQAVRALDQFVYRFGKLQDAAGMQLFPAILGALEEPYREWAMKDRLNRLEQLGILAELDYWETLRAVRNRLVREYPDNSERQTVILNEAWAQAPRLLSVVESVIEAATRQVGQ